MGITHAAISNLDAMRGLLLQLQWFMTGHYGWLTHRFATPRSPGLWRHLSALLTNLDWLVGHWPSNCPAGVICAG